MTVFCLPKPRNMRLFTNAMTRNSALVLAFAQLAVPAPVHNDAISLTKGVWQAEEYKKTTHQLGDTLCRHHQLYAPY